MKREAPVAQLDRALPSEAGKDEWLVSYKSFILQHFLSTAAVKRVIRV
jgi:hypothetical protein